MKNRKFSFFLAYERIRKLYA